MTSPPQSGDNKHVSTAAMARLSAFFGEHIPVIMTLGVRGVAVLAGFAVTYILGRYFGPEANGQYALVTQTAITLAVAGMLGLDQSVIRHFSKAVSEQKPLATNVVLQVLSFAFLLTLVWIIALGLGGTAVWKILFGDAIGIELLAVFCLLLFARTGVQILGSMLRSQHRFVLSMMVMTFFIPASAALALLSDLATDVEETLWAAALGCFLALAIAMIAIRPHMSQRPDATSIPMKAIFASSFPLWGTGLSLVIGEWYGLAVAARMLSVADAGLYRVSAQIAGIVLLMSSTLFSVYTARISTAFHSGSREEAARIAKTAVRVSTALALPFSLIILLLGEFVLAQIGPEFVAAMPILAILVIGQLLIVLAGQAGLVLAMSGNEKITLAISLGGTLAVLVLAPFGAWYAGLTGLTLAISGVLVVRAAVAYAIVRSRLGIDIWTGKVSPLD